jgi:putative phosphoesterase
VVLAVISDTHMPRHRRRLPGACVKRLRDADAILHAGDIMEPEFLDELEALGPHVHAVHGNQDAPELRLRLPATRIVNAGGVRIGMIHDAGASAGRLERMRRRFPDAGAVIFGHSHIPLRERAEDGFQIFNPGSPTDRRRSPRHTMGLAHVEDGAVVFELIDLV